MYQLRVTFSSSINNKWSKSQMLRKKIIIILRNVHPHDQLLTCCWVFKKDVKTISSHHILYSFGIWKKKWCKYNKDVRTILSLRWFWLECLSWAIVIPSCLEPQVCASTNFTDQTAMPFSINSITTSMCFYKFIWILEGAKHAGFEKRTTNLLSQVLVQQWHWSWSSILVLLKRVDATKQ